MIDAGVLREDAGRYRTQTTHGRTARLTPACLPGLAVSVDEILGAS